MDNLALARDLNLALAHDLNLTLNHLKYRSKQIDFNIGKNYNQGLRYSWKG